ncbi:hypothetical protein AB1Y20_003009 [Prymnesium parvum]|uniref:Cilia- and flagella-associated protein 157 n=1 Tax=Prymnesium parvum TaxID=97485 RepID=A0AB34JDC3_PRYPA
MWSVEHAQDEPSEALERALLSPAAPPAASRPPSAPSPRSESPRHTPGPVVKGRVRHLPDAGGPAALMLRERRRQRESEQGIGPMAAREALRSPRGRRRVLTPRAAQERMAEQLGGRDGAAVVGQSSLERQAQRDQVLGVRVGSLELHRDMLLDKTRELESERDEWRREALSLREQLTAQKKAHSEAVQSLELQWADCVTREQYNKMSQRLVDERAVSKKRERQLLESIELLEEQSTKQKEELTKMKAEGVTTVPVLELSETAKNEVALAKIFASSFALNLEVAPHEEPVAPEPSQLPILEALADIAAAAAVHAHMDTNRDGAEYSHFLELMGSEASAAAGERAAKAAEVLSAGGIDEEEVLKAAREAAYLVCTFADQAEEMQLISGQAPRRNSMKPPTEHMFQGEEVDEAKRKLYAIAAEADAVRMRSYRSWPRTLEAAARNGRGLYTWPLDDSSDGSSIGDDEVSLARGSTRDVEGEGGGVEGGGEAAPPPPQDDTAPFPHGEAAPPVDETSTAVEAGEETAAPHDGGAARVVAFHEVNINYNPSPVESAAASEAGSLPESAAGSMAGPAERHLLLMLTVWAASAATAAVELAQLDKLGDVDSFDAATLAARCAIAVGLKAGQGEKTLAQQAQAAARRAVEALVKGFDTAAAEEKGRRAAAGVKSAAEAMREDILLEGGSEIDADIAMDATAQAAPLALASPP